MPSGPRLVNHCHRSELVSTSACVTVGSQSIQSTGVVRESGKQRVVCTWILLIFDFGTHVKGGGVFRKHMGQFHVLGLPIWQLNLPTGHFHEADFILSLLTCSLSLTS